MIRKSCSNTKDDFNLKIISNKIIPKSRHNSEFQTIKKTDSITITGTPKEKLQIMQIISAIVRDTARTRVKMTSPLSRTLTVTRTMMGRATTITNWLPLKTAWGALLTSQTASVISESRKVSRGF